MGRRKLLSYYWLRERAGITRKVGLGLDRARAYEFNVTTDEFEARAEVGGTADPDFASLGQAYHLKRDREDPISFFTYEERQMRVFKRGEFIEYNGPHGPEQVHILFKCDGQVGSEGLEHLLDIPLIISDQIVGKISADCIKREQEGNDDCLHELLKNRRTEIEYFAIMAARAIQDAHRHMRTMYWWERIDLLRRGLSDTTRTVLLAFACAVIGSVATAFVQYLLPR